MSIDASAVTYSPEDDNDWKDNVDPGEVDDALDQLAEETVKGPSSSTDNAISRWDGTSGKRLQDSSVSLDDQGGMSGVKTISGKSGNDLNIIALGGASNKLFALGGTGAAAGGDGGDATFKGGAGGLASGKGGTAILGGGVPLDGNGGDADVTAADGVGTNKAGGICNYTAGTNTGSGTVGAHIFDDKKVGMGVGVPKEQLHVDDAIALSNNAEGSTARLVRRTSHETHTLAAAGTSDTTTISIPSGARLLAVSMNVNTAVTRDGIGNTWDVAFITGSTTTIKTVVSPNQNTKVDFIVPDDEKTTAVTEVRFTVTSGTTFTGGVIEVVAYYEELVSLADV